MPDSLHLDPCQLDQWFPVERQKHYIQQVRKQVVLTQRRAQCFVRLWAYLMLKQRVLQQRSLPSNSVVTLVTMTEEVPCSHQEAADVFYANSDRGSDRSAGMMIDELVKLKLVSRTFDGNMSTIQIRPMANIDHGLTSSKPIPVATDYQPNAFNPRTDAVFAAQLLAGHYNWVSTDANTIAYRISQTLRRWSQDYAMGLRVLRYGNPAKLVGVYCLFPTAATSNLHFFESPSQSLYLSTDRQNDPVKIAVPGDPDCTTVFIRSWAIDSAHVSHVSVQQSFADMRRTLVQMQQDFPNLCDLYALSINPGSEAIAQAIGFHKTVQDPDLPLAWLYIPLDQFLELDMEGAIARLNFPS